jgi:hypothetical protein
MVGESATPIKLERPGAGDGARQDEKPPSSFEQRTAARLERSADLLRSELIEEIIAMIHYGTSNGLSGTIEPVAGDVFDRLAEGVEMPSTSDLLAAHHSLRVLIAPATPTGVRVYCQMRGSRARLFGPHSAIQRLSLANLLFMSLFFGTSLSTLINADTLHLSVYEQSGAPLLFKLLFITAVSGIGASFAVLFEAWEDVRRRRFDPVMESSYWLQIGLGVVAGIILTEIVQTGAPDQQETGIKEPLIALAGGFSAGLLHVVLSRVVKTIRSIFEPPEK